jgi:glycosyltransferase involved in cell wall biosynthesis
MTTGFRAVQVGLDVVPEMGGITVAIRDFQDALGGEIVSFTLPELIPADGSDGIHHVPLHRSPLGSAYAWSPAAMRRHAEELVRRADLVVVHGLYRYYSQWARTLARRSRTPYWVVPHGALDPYVFTYRRWQKEPWMHLVGKRLMQDAVRVIFSSSRELAKAARRIDTANAALVPWPVEGLRAQDAGPVRLRLRRRLGISDDARVLLFLGRLHPAKRPLETIEALAAAATPEVHLLVVGPDSAELSRQHCRRHADAVGARNIHLLGPVFGVEKWSCFAAADALINLSHKENFGYTVAEALSSGLPVVVSPGNDLGPEVRSVRCGWVLTTDTVAEAASILRRFAEIPRDELGAMGERGRCWAVRELSRERFTERLRELAADALSARRSLAGSIAA